MEEDEPGLEEPGLSEDGNQEEGVAIGNGTVPEAAGDAGVDVNGEPRSWAWSIVASQTAI